MPVVEEITSKGHGAQVENDGHKRPIKVLLAEDDKVDQRAFKKMVADEMLPYDCTVAGSVRSALQSLAGDAFDIIIADYRLGDGTAFDIMAVAGDTPVIIATGAGDEETAVQALKQGAYDYLIKDPAHHYLKVLPHTLEKACRQREAVLQNRILSQALLSLNEGVFITDEHDRIMLTNPAFENIYGHAMEEVKGRTTDFLWVNPPDDPSSSPKQPTIEGEFTSLKKDGSPLTIDLSRTRIVDHRGRNLASVGVIRDITARKAELEALRESRAEAQRYAKHLEKRNRELDQFSYAISHDLKAPLRAITHLSQWIEEDLAGTLTDQTREYLELLRDRVYRLNRLIESLLQYSRIGRRQDTLETIAVGALLAEIIDSLAPPEGFEVVIDPDMPTLHTSRLHLTQVFTNLIGNALVHHDNPPGRIAIGVTKAQGRYRFSVSDDGPGIDPLYQEKIFEIFQTVRGLDDSEGTGIGLALVRKIVEENGGVVAVRSAIGQGATFTFTWPIDPA